jgi:hypothetical protein
MGDCTGRDPDLWFSYHLGPAPVTMGKRGAERTYPPSSRWTTAKAICSRCPQQESCLAGSLERRELYGVWGGLDEHQRRDVLARRLSVPQALQLARAEGVFVAVAS